MSINTIANAARNNQMPYVDDNNIMQGICNPLKMFFCKSGASIDSNNTANTKWDAAVGGMSFKDVSMNLVNNRVSCGYNDTLFQTASPSTLFKFGTISDQTDILIVSSASVRGAVHNVGINGAVGSNTPRILASGGNTSTGNNRSYITDGYATDTMGSALQETAGTVYTLALSANLRDSVTDIGGYLKVIESSGLNSDMDDSSLTLVNTYGNLDFATDTTLTISGEFNAFGIFFFPNESMPEDWKTQALMMGHQWSLGNYVFPEAWQTI